MSKRFGTLISFTTLAAVLVACGSPSSTGKPAAPTQAPAAQAPAAPAAKPTMGAEAQPKPAAGAPRQVSGKVTLYTSIPADIANQIKKDFETAHPGVDVELFQSGSERVIQKITAEMEAGGVKADLLALADRAYFDTLKKEGVLQPYQSPEAATIPEALKDSDGLYTTIRIISQMIVYNPTLVKPEEAPTNWTDLTDPKWKGQIIIPSPLYSGSTYVAVGALAQHYGWDFFEKLRANDTVVEEGNQGVERKIAAGEFKVGMLLDLNVRQAQSKETPIEMLMPTDGAVIIPSPIAITKDATNVPAAQAFVDFILSPEGQRSIVNGFMIPVRTEVPPPQNALTAEEQLKRSLPMDWPFLTEKQDEVKERFTKIMLD